MGAESHSIEAQSVCKNTPKFASKWLKNKFLKGKQGESISTTEDKIDDAGSDGVIKDPHKIDYAASDEVIKDPHKIDDAGSDEVVKDPPKIDDAGSDEVVKDPHKIDDAGSGVFIKDQLPGVCHKDGGCESLSFSSSNVHRSILEHVDSDYDSRHSNSDDLDTVEGDISSSDKEQSNNKGKFLQILAIAVTKFNKCHTIFAVYGLQLLKTLNDIIKPLAEQIGMKKTIEFVEIELKQGPQGLIVLTVMLVAFAGYFMLSIMCSRKILPAYGPNLKDIFKTYEGRINILEEECLKYEISIKNMKRETKEVDDGRSALERQLDDEKHERCKSEEQNSILKKIVDNLNEKVELLEEESSKLKQSLEQKAERIRTVDDKLSETSKEVEEEKQQSENLKRELTTKDDEINVLKDVIDEYKRKLSQSEDDSNRHKTTLQEWNERYHELQQKCDDISLSNQTLEEQIKFKDNEIEILRDSLVQINTGVNVNSDEELSQEEVQEAKLNKIKELMDVSQIRADFKVCLEEKESLEQNMKIEVEKREKLEGEVERLELELDKTKASEEEIRFKYRETDIKLNTLQDYFKNMEKDLHRKLTAEEAARMASESELERKLREASSAVRDVDLYRKQAEELKKEINATQQSFQSQISSVEERAHENWLKFRSAERELEELKRERNALRRRLYEMETSSKSKVSSEDNNPGALGDIPQSQLESPSTNVRSSSKRVSANSRKSPSSVEDRKRKQREKNSTPSWEIDKSSYRREKDRETPPPPPLWDRNSSRRRGRKDSSDGDMDDQRGDRYTPSPPPPPLDLNARRYRGDMRSSPPPPPPPSHVLARPMRMPIDDGSSPPLPFAPNFFSPRVGRFPIGQPPAPSFGVQPLGLIAHPPPAMVRSHLESTLPQSFAPRSISSGPLRPLESNRDHSLEKLNDSSSFVNKSFNAERSPPSNIPYSKQRTIQKAENLP
ncbi:transport and Golgi organization protein 1 homolog isoform X2 [Xenia sp. Carnegie-2017]|uniref:transport and Golgi organization protein 1 homolog isoform X2 n=1 Tax=Xenia sp. Carnegie-2017 TaxID=2897299 RepID=UPI001F0363D9|nr:transport and Golgi organization protein 1 homolog isoform X2 [Xenia sp. Carnegie-2017]